MECPRKCGIINLTFSKHAAILTMPVDTAVTTSKTSRSGDHMLIALMTEAVSTYETSVNIYHTTGATFDKTAVFTLAAVKT
jgi:hypothetical protein